MADDPGRLAAEAAADPDGAKAPAEAERTPILALSDPLNAPTGFGRVARELFTRLPQDRFRLGYLSQWVGSRWFPGITTYGHTSRFAADGLVPAQADFAGNARFVLWTLLDPWMTSWISHPEISSLGTPSTRGFFRGGGRKKFVWVGHFPIDGLGPRHGPARWVEEYVDAMDLPVAMSEWGRRIVQPLVKREMRFVPHAVNDGFRPMPRAEAREQVELAGFRDMLIERAVAHGLGEGDVVPPEVALEARRRSFRFGDGFAAICVMANRERKYWPEVLRAFALLAEDHPDARLVGVCGDRKGMGDDQWALEEIARELGLRLDGEADDPNVWLLEFTQDGPGDEPDHSMRLLYCACDAAVLLSGGEGFGLPQLEAHACGIPCVAGDYSASTELAVDRRELIEPAHWRETPGNQVQRPLYRPRDLAQRLKWAAANPDWRKEAGAAGTEQAAAHRWEKILPRWLDVFAEAAALLGQRGAEASDAGREKQAVPSA